MIDHRLGKLHKNNYASVPKHELYVWADNEVIRIIDWIILIFLSDSSKHLFQGRFCTLDHIHIFSGQRTIKDVVTSIWDWGKQDLLYPRVFSSSL